jgi:hypothetical protein
MLNLLPPGLLGATIAAGWSSDLSTDFDGTDDYANIDAALTPLATTTKGMWSAWTKGTDVETSGSRVIIGAHGTTVSTRFYLFINAGKVGAFCAESGVTQWYVLTDAVVLTNNTWQHIALVQDGVSPVIYIDGVAEAQTFSVTTDKTYWFNDFSTIDNFRIGCRDFNSGGQTLFWNGGIDDVTIWDDDFTSGEITSWRNSGTPTDPLVFSKSANLTAHYSMGDDDTHPTLTDRSTNADHGTLVNGTSGDFVSDTPPT